VELGRGYLVSVTKVERWSGLTAMLGGGKWVERGHDGKKESFESLTPEKWEKDIRLGPNNPTAEYTGKPGPD